MPYSILREETLPAAVRRIVDEEIVRAREQLTDQTASMEERVHDARKRFKEIRAVVRLVRQPLGANYPVENAWFRDAGRDLSGVRDSAAVLESLRKLSRARRLSRTTKRRALSILSSRRDAVSASELDAKIANVLEQLVIAQARVALWPSFDDSFDAIGGGLRRAYRTGRRAMDEARQGGLPRLFHEWRKTAKTQWYHALLLRNVWPEMMKPWAGVLEHLSRTLGDHHDLFVLRQIVAASANDLGKRGAVVDLLDAIDSRQIELEQEALRAGAKIYAETPKAWLARIRNLWSAWRS